MYIFSNFNPYACSIMSLVYFALQKESLQIECHACRAHLSPLAYKSSDKGSRAIPYLGLFWYCYAN